jgi:hypothetical protein
MSNEMQQRAVFILFYCNVPVYVSDACPIYGHYLMDLAYHVTETHDLYQWL